MLYSDGGDKRLVRNTAGIKKFVWRFKIPKTCDVSPLLIAPVVKTHFGISCTFRLKNVALAPIQFRLCPIIPKTYAEAPSPVVVYLYFLPTWKMQQRCRMTKICLTAPKCEKVAGGKLRQVGVDAPSPSRRLNRPSSLDLRDALSADDVAPSVDRRRLPLSFAVWISKATVALRGACWSVPTVDADVGRPIAQVVAHATVGIRRARLAETHSVRKPFPWIAAASTPHHNPASSSSSPIYLCLSRKHENSIWQSHIQRTGQWDHNGTEHWPSWWPS